MVRILQGLSRWLTERPPKREVMFVSLFHFFPDVAAGSGKRRADVFRVKELLRSFGEAWLCADSTCVSTEKNFAQTLKAFQRGIIDERHFDLRVAEARRDRSEAQRIRLWKRFSSACRVAHAFYPEISSDPRKYLTRSTHVQRSASKIDAERKAASVPAATPEPATHTQ